ncbi:unnamed protein product [Trifolium pratense]|uniref:Uncharacterized protein n=1 Tax=Trifolium pratense TaxID=57577 RepID=A0ACB0KIJ3_TRIPR|nr:unnamed protein product [Trifolium pratense]
MNIDKLREWANGNNTITKTCDHSPSSSATNKFGSHAAGIRKAMQILESQFALSDNPDLFGGSSSHPQEPINAIATNGDEFGEGDNNNRKKKSPKKNDDGSIHSIPCQKYGPYTCPFCNKKVTTSQLFASHVKWNHHKDGKKKK